MMRPVTALFLGLLCVAAAQPALAGDRGPVCRQPSVVDEMTRMVRDQNYYSQVNPALVTEQPTADPREVRCQVCVESAPYNMTRYGDRPVGRCVAFGFGVRVLPNGFVVQSLR